MSPASLASTVAAIAGLSLLGAAAARHGAALLLLNESPSLPEGLYLRAPDRTARVGAIVAVRQPATAAPYLARLGMPPDVRLLKRIAAAGGDIACRAAGTVSVAGRRFHALDHDRRGVKLPGWSGCRRLGADEVFVVGDTPNSFDSRYFGPVPEARLDGVFRAWLTW
jgi:type IV secretory pathway protease TraF